MLMTELKPTDVPPLGSNIERIVAIVELFAGDNQPRRTIDVISGLGIAQATGFGLIRAMVEANLLEKTAHGMVRLGEQAKVLGFIPIGAYYTEVKAERNQVYRFNTQRSIPKQLEPSPTAWDQELLQRVNTQAFMRSGKARIALLTASKADLWRLALLRSIHYGIKLNEAKVEEFRVWDAGDDESVQCQQIDEALSEGFDVLLVSATPDDTGALSAALKGSLERGVAVVAVDRRPNDHDAYLSFVTASEASIAKISARWMVEKIGYKGRIWMFSGIQGASTSIVRQAAALEEFTRYKDIQIEAVVYTDWDPIKGYEAVNSLLETWGNAPDGIWCDSGLQGIGAVQAFLDLGMQPPPHTGGDLNKMYKLCLDNRVPFSALDYPATMGAHSVDILFQVLAGKEVPKRVEEPLTVVIPRGHETKTVKADELAEKHVRWNLPDDTILSQGAVLEVSTDEVEPPVETS